MAHTNDPDQSIQSYIAAARPVQALLQQVLTQVAGYALLLMTSNARASRPQAALQMARAAADRAHDETRGIRVPPTAAHHYHHLLKAAETTRLAFAAADRCAGQDVTEGERDTLTRVLAAASAHLRATSQLLPGFEMVDFGQACCAVHAPAAPQTNALTF